MIYFLYGLSILFVTTPLCHILYKRQLQDYFVYFLSVSTFMIINLIGSISNNILNRYENKSFYMVFLFTSLMLFILYWIINYFKKKKGVVDPLAKRLLSSFANNNVTLKNFIVLSFVLCLIGMVLFTLKVSPPFYLRSELFQPPSTPHELMLTQVTTSSSVSSAVSGENKLAAPAIRDVVGPPLHSPLINERMKIVMSRPFHWFGLLAFEMPLLMTIVAFVAFRVSKENQAIENLSQLRRWRKRFIRLIIFAFASSLWILSKQYLMYLIASLCFLELIIRNGLNRKILLIYFLVFFLSLFALYSVMCGNLIKAETFPRLCNTLWHRIFEVYPWASAIAYDLFPREVAFLQGKSMINLFHLFNFQPVSVANMIYPHIYGNSNGSAPLPAIFECYANWGWFGIIVAEIMIGLSILAVSLLSWSSNIWAFCLSVYCSIKLILVWQSPFWFGAFEPTTLFFIAVTSILYYFCKVFLSKMKYQLRNFQN